MSAGNEQELLDEIQYLTSKSVSRARSQYFWYQLMRLDSQVPRRSLAWPDPILGAE